jgi:DNA polymerase
MAACKPWWQGEVAAIRPVVLGLLGAVAAQAVFGAPFRVTKQRGEWFELPSGVWAMATVHPSAVLRAEARREQELAGLVRDLRARL